MEESLSIHYLKKLRWSCILIFFFFNSSVYSSDLITAKQGMVVSEQHLASRVGVDILRAGGNAIDAAVAVGYALAVVDPCCGNIGGGGMMTIHLANGKNIFLNFRERAPLSAKADMYLDKTGNIIPEKSTLGYLAVAVPGTVLGLETALKKYGTMSRQQIMQPAIKLAEEGFILQPGDINLLSAYISNFRKQPNIAAIFLKYSQSYKVGERLVQKDLANTLKEIANKGSDVFYKGSIATSIVNASQKNSGILSLNDFANYYVEEFNPVFCSYHGYTIISSPPPSSGGVTLCEMLNILEDYPLKYFGYHTPRSTYFILEAMRYAYFDRNFQLGDPDFVNNPVQKLISKEYAAQIRKKINAVQKIPSTQYTEPTEGVNTTHYSVMDKWGNAVSVTYTLNSYFGAKVIAGNTGFFLNDEMDDFSSKPGSKNQFGLVQGSKNSIAPGKRPLSSMTPTIVLKNNHVVMILGSPGGPRITTAVLETLLNVLDYGMDIQSAVNASRFHFQGIPDSVDIEPLTFSSFTLATLSTLGYHFMTHDPWGAVEAIYYNPITNIMYGANDIRRPAGSAGGY